MNMMKPCPFCGAKITFDSSGSLFAWHRSDCFLQLLVNHQMDMTEEKNRQFVVMTWNRRHENDEVDVVRCCECVYHDDESLYHYCHKWNRNCPDDSDFFCKWGKRMNGGQDE